MEDWRVGRLEDWKIGRMDCWMVGRMEDWKDGGMEGCRIGGMEDWIDGLMDCWMAGRMEDWRVGTSLFHSSTPPFFHPSILPPLHSSTPPFFHPFTLPFFHPSILPLLCLPDEVAYLHELDERPKRIKPALGIDNVLYVDEQGCAIKKTGERLLVVKENEVLRDIPLIHLGQVVISGNVSLTTPAMQTLLYEGIPVVFLSAYGRYHGALIPQVSRNSLLRTAQHRVATNEAQCLELSKAFVRGKLTNMRTMLQRRKWQAPDSTDLTLEPLLANIKTIQKMEKRVDSATNITELLGIEGNASAAYFGSFNFMLKEEMGFDFQRRSRRPPADPTNALLSFAYSLLTADVLSAIQVVGLDPYVGYFHQLKYGKPCLSLDLMEEFRPIIADSVVITLINNRRIKPTDFTQSHGGWYLKDNSRKAFYAAYETRKNETITHPVFKYKLTFRRAMELQVRLLAKSITGEIDKYTALTIR